MRKLTDEQRKQIIAEYAKGVKSQRTLAKEYGVSPTIIMRLVSKGECGQVLTKETKKKNTQTMLAYFEGKKDIAQSILTKILSAAEKEIESASLRDKMGALKIISDIFINNSTIADLDHGVTVNVNFADCSEGKDDGN